MHHLIIGAGPAATHAIETLRQFEGSRSSITLVCDEPAHSRMALPYWLAGAISETQTRTGDAGYFAKLGVTTRFGGRATSLDAAGKTVTLDDGTRVAFDSLLIATGSSPLVPDIEGASLPGVQPLWSLAHAGRVLQQVNALEASGRTPRVVLVGAGFIGFIVLGALHKRKCSLAVVERERQVLPRMLDATAARHVERWLAKRSVAVHTGVGVKRIQQQPDGATRVELSDGQAIPADIVIVATGIRPNLEIVAGTAIATDEAILVDDRMRTSVAGVYAAGDVAQGPVLFGTGREVHPIQPTAVDHGRIAGANMAGHEVHYPGSLAMNVVDVCGLQAASFGRWHDPRAEATTIDNPDGSVCRKLLWTDDLISGAIFVGRADDVGMLTDIGMVKGLMQTQARLGPWKKHLQEYPFDVRRAYVGSGVPAKLVASTLLGRPAVSPQFGH